MRIAAFGAAAVAALGAMLLAANMARADSCETFPGSQVYTDNCGPGAINARPPAQTARPPSQPGHTSLREQLRQLFAADAAQSRAVADARKRWQDAANRAQRATDDAQQTNDPARRAQLKRQYESAMRDLHRAGADLVKADPEQREQIEALLKDYDVQGANAAAAVGFIASPAPTAATAAPQKRAAPDNVTEIGGKTYICDGPIAGANNVSCREISTDGTECTAVTLADGVVGWHDSINSQCGAADLAQRAAFVASKPHTAAFPADAPFAMDPDETRRKIDKLMAPAQTPEEALFAQLPSQCADTFKKYLDDVGASHTNTAEGQFHAADAIDSYQTLDASQECRDAIKRIADANALELPVRHLRPRTRNAFASAMAADPSRLLPQAPTELEDTGYSADEVLEFGFALLNLASGAASLANAMHGGGGFSPGAIGGAVRSVAPGPPRAISCNVRGCVTTNGLGPSNNQSTITGH